MFRKLMFTLAATAAIGAAALAPTTASAKGWGWHHHHHWGHHWHHGFRVRFFAPAYYGGCYIAHRWVWTRHGERLRRVEVCD